MARTSRSIFVGNVLAGEDDEPEQAGSVTPNATRDISASELFANRIIKT